MDAAQDGGEDTENKENRGGGGRNEFHYIHTDRKKGLYLGLQNKRPTWAIVHHLVQPAEEFRVFRLLVKLFFNCAFINRPACATCTFKMFLWYQQCVTLTSSFKATPRLFTTCPLITEKWSPMREWTCAIRHVKIKDETLRKSCDILILWQNVWLLSLHIMLTCQEFARGFLEWGLFEIEINIFYL